MGDYSYVPSLKGKRGEHLALQELSEEVKSNIKPIVNIINSNNDICKFYNGQAFIDLHMNIFEAASNQTITGTFKQIYETSSQKSELTSVLKHGYSKELIQQIKPFLFDIEKGIALRIPWNSLSSLELDIKTISEILSINSGLIDVIIDFGCINDMAISLTQELSDNIKNATSKVEIRNVIIISSAFPEGINIHRDSIGELPRYDWQLYTNIHKRIPKIIFGDYGADDPYDSQINSRRNIVPTIRYTTDNSWKIIRGIYDPAMPFDFSQFIKLSEKLIGCDFYKGRDFSWGDNKIYQCANGECSNGNLETWVRVAMNHHITFVSNERARPL